MPKGLDYLSLTVSFRDFPNLKQLSINNSRGKRPNHMDKVQLLFASRSKIVNQTLILNCFSGFCPHTVAFPVDVFSCQSWHPLLLVMGLRETFYSFQRFDILFTNFGLNN